MKDFCALQFFLNLQLKNVSIPGRSPCPIILKCESSQIILCPTFWKDIVNVIGGHTFLYRARVLSLTVAICRETSAPTSDNFIPDMVEENKVSKTESIICPLHPFGDNQQNQRELRSFDDACYTSILTYLQVPFAGGGGSGEEKSTFLN